MIFCFIRWNDTLKKMNSRQEPKSNDTLKVLKEKAMIFERSLNYPIKLWISSAKKLYEQAFKFENELQFEIAYVKYLRASSIVIEIIPNHKDYILFKSQGGIFLKQYQELKQVN